jgi:hypothetical protein
MAIQTIGNMTREQLQQLIEQTVERKLIELLGEDADMITFRDDETDTRSLDEVFESIDRNMWTPPSGSKSSLDLLREDRES